MVFYCNNKKDYCDNPLDCDNCDVLVLGKGGKFVPTNGDRIREMTDEELGIFLGEWASNPSIWKTDGIGECLAWLQTPLKEEK